MVEQLLKAQTEERIIKDAYDYESNVINQDYDTYNKWAIKPRIIKAKKYVKAEMIVQIKKKVNTYGLYMNQRDYCDSNKIRIKIKRTGMEYTKRQDFYLELT